MRQIKPSALLGKAYIPIGSMGIMVYLLTIIYNLFTYIHVQLIFMVNVGKYTIPMDFLGLKFTIHWLVDDILQYLMFMFDPSL